MTFRRALATAAVLALAACGGGDADVERLALGTEAVVPFVRAASGDTPAVDTTLGVTVLAVREGTQQDLIDGGFTIDEEIENTKPYYVDVRYENQGTTAADRSLTVGLEDDDGNSVPSTIVTNLSGEPFAPCERAEAGPLEPGDSFESCTLILVEEGVTLELVRFVSQDKAAAITFTEWAVE